MKPCPACEQLEAMLAERLDADEQDSLELHVTQCPDCQRALQQLTEMAFFGPSALSKNGQTSGSFHAETASVALDREFMAKLKAARPARPRLVDETPRESGDGQTTVPPTPVDEGWPEVEGFQIIRE